MSSLFSTICMLPLHLTVEMSIALCIGMKTVVTAFGTSINSLGCELAGPLAGEFIGEEVQPNCSGWLYSLTRPRISNLRLGWSIIDRKYYIQRSIRSGLSPILI